MRLEQMGLFPSETVKKTFDRGAQYSNVKSRCEACIDQKQQKGERMHLSMSA
jgi:hypothetical protein